MISTSAMPRRRHLVASGKDDVLHAGAAHGRRALLAHRPDDGVGDIALAAAVRTDHDGDAGLETELDRARERFESPGFYGLKKHVSPFRLPVNRPAAQSAYYPNQKRARNRWGCGRRVRKNLPSVPAVPPVLPSPPPVGIPSWCLPLPRPSTSPSRTTSEVKSRACGGPSASTTS